MDPITIAMGLAQFAPQIIRWLNGSDKAAEAAERVVQVAQAVTGKPAAEAMAQITADPGALLQFRQRIAEIEAQMDKDYLADRQGARDRDVELAKAGRSNRRADILAFLAVSALVFCVWMVASQPDLPPGAREAIMFVAGVFAAAVRDVYGFEFGSSRGSKDKDELMAHLSKRP